MQTLISAALQFPTIVFTFLLALIALYWLLVLIRLAPLELFERDSLRDDHMASTLVSLGFAGVPATLALSFLMLIAGALSLAVELLALRWMPLGLLRVPVGVLVVWAALAVASPSLPLYAMRCSVRCTVINPSNVAVCWALPSWWQSAKTTNLPALRCSMNPAVRSHCTVKPGTARSRVSAVCW